MRTLFIIPLVLMSLVSFPSWGADFNKGMDAYNDGDYATAFKEWKPLAEQGDAYAQIALGVMYANGQGVPQDYKEAARWYRLAAEQGDAISQFYLGFFYGNGLGLEQDNEEASKWYFKSASKGAVSYTHLTLPTTPYV